MLVESILSCLHASKRTELLDIYTGYTLKPLWGLDLIVLSIYTVYHHIQKFQVFSLVYEYKWLKM